MLGSDISLYNQVQIINYFEQTREKYPVIAKKFQVPCATVRDTLGNKFVLLRKYYRDNPNKKRNFSYAKDLIIKYELMRWCKIHKHDKVNKSDLSEAMANVKNKWKFRVNLSTEWLCNFVKEQGIVVLQQDKQSTAKDNLEEYRASVLNRRRSVRNIKVTEHSEKIVVEQSSVVRNTCKSSEKTLDTFSEKKKNIENTNESMSRHTNIENEKETLKSNNAELNEDIKLKFRKKGSSVSKCSIPKKDTCNLEIKLSKSFKKLKKSSRKNKKRKSSRDIEPTTETSDKTKINSVKCSSQTNYGENITNSSFLLNMKNQSKTDEVNEECSVSECSVTKKDTSNLEIKFSKSIRKREKSSRKNKKRKFSRDIKPASETSDKTKINIVKCSSENHCEKENITNSPFILNMTNQNRINEMNEESLINPPPYCSTPKRKCTNKIHEMVTDTPPEEVQQSYNFSILNCDDNDTTEELLDIGRIDSTNGGQVFSSEVGNERNNRWTIDQQSLLAVSWSTLFPELEQPLTAEQLIEKINALQFDYDLNAFNTVKIQVHDNPSSQSQPMAPNQMQQSPNQMQGVYRPPLPPAKPPAPRGPVGGPRMPPGPRGPMNPRGPMARPRAPMIRPRGPGATPMRGPVRPRMGAPQNGMRPNGPASNVKRSPDQANAMAKRKKLDVLTPSDKDDDDCQVICMQPKNTDGGLPQIESVQGASESAENSIMHLSDSITLSVRNPPPKPVVSPQKSDAKAVANILATRGITVTATAKPKEKENKQGSAIPTALSLNGAVSIVASPKTNGTNNSKPASENLPTVDLTDDTPTPKPATPTKKGPGLPFRCDLCPAQYPNAMSLNKHRQTYHKTTGGMAELGIPLINLKQAGIMMKLTQLGIHSYIPLPSAGSDGTYAFPIINTKQACNVSALGATQMLTLGPVRSIPRPTIPSSPVTPKK